MASAVVLAYPYCAAVEHLFAAVRDLPDALWLDSARPRCTQGRYDIITAAPLQRLETWGNTTTLTAAGSSPRVYPEPFAVADQVLAEIGRVEAAGLPFAGGWAGYLGYDLGRPRPPAGAVSPGLARVAELRLCCYGWGLVVDHALARAALVFHPTCPAALRRDVEHRLARPGPCTEGAFGLRTPFAPSIDRAAYLQQVHRIQDYIGAGDCYQVNFAQHFAATFGGDPWQAYRHLRRALPSAHSAFLAWGEQAVLSCSPERLLRIDGDWVETEPIKGTRPRGATPAEDLALADALRGSGKDRAENLMIVDLLRNDLGKTCIPGSIRVPELYRLESLANVHHLVSRVTARRAPEVSPLTVLAGCFPGGSITGAPKKRAMEIIAELEAVPRALYCGSIGYASASGHLDFNIAIRTLVATGNELHCWGGGGIVADSVAADEYRETLAKVGLLMATLAAL